jgi:hypothetical protein
MKAPHRVVVATIAFACLFVTLPAAGQAVLLVVREKADGKPLPPPFAVREGLSGSLFDAGFIVIDAPGTAAIPGPGELARLARSAGAEIVLQCSTEYADTKIGADLLRIAARTSYSVIDSSTGEILAHGTRESTNRGREQEVGRTALGGEIGRDVAVQVRKSLPKPA